MEETKKAPKRKTLAELFGESCCVELKSTVMHQAFQIMGVGTESSLNSGRKGMGDIKMVFHPGYGLIGHVKGKFFLSPSANVVVGSE